MCPPQNCADGFTKNFKVRRRLCHTKMLFINLLLLILTNCVLCSDIENDVLTLQDDLGDIGDIDDKGGEVIEPSDRRRPSNDQEKDILLLEALGRRKGQHSSYSSSQEDDSIMDLLGKSKLIF